MKEYWTDTIIDRFVPAGTDVERRGPIRIYIADGVADLARRVLPYVNHPRHCAKIKAAINNALQPCNCGVDKLKAELERIAGIPLKISRE